MWIIRGRKSGKRYKDMTFASKADAITFARQNGLKGDKVQVVELPSSSTKAKDIFETPSSSAMGKIIEDAKTLPSEPQPVIATEITKPSLTPLDKYIVPSLSLASQASETGKVPFTDALRLAGSDILSLPGRLAVGAGRGIGSFLADDDYGGEKSIRTPWTERTSGIERLLTNPVLPVTVATGALTAPLLGAGILPTAGAIGADIATSVGAGAAFDPEYGGSDVAFDVAGSVIPVGLGAGLKAGSKYLAASKLAKKLGDTELAKEVAQEAIQATPTMGGTLKKYGITKGKENTKFLQENIAIGEIPDTWFKLHKEGLDMKVSSGRMSLADYDKEVKELNKLKQRQLQVKQLAEGAILEPQYRAGLTGDELSGDLQILQENPKAIASAYKSMTPEMLSEIQSPELQSVAVNLFTKDAILKANPELADMKSTIDQLRVTGGDLIQQGKTEAGIRLLDKSKEMSKQFKEEFTKKSANLNKSKYYKMLEQGATPYSLPSPMDIGGYGLNIGTAKALGINPYTLYGAGSMSRYIPVGFTAYDDQEQ